MAAYYLEHATRLGSVATVLTVAVPVAVYVLMVYVLHDLLMRQVDAIHALLLVGTAVLLVAPVVLAAIGMSMAQCLVVLMFAPVVTVVGYETVGHRYQADALARTA